MLHEVLLALSGHSSPLFAESDNSHSPADDLPYLSPSETALLASLGRLSTLHRRLERLLEQIAAEHPSTICRAVATSIREVHLSRWQDQILRVESGILSKDASLVGAYEIVPLAGVVGQFDEWQRRMPWYCDIASFMQPGKTSCTGAAIINRLRSERKTGFSDIEAIATELTVVAETAWMRQLASWLLYGRLPSFGADDFFVRVQEQEGTSHFSKQQRLLPEIVNSSTASSILFIGKSLHQVRQYGRQTVLSSTSVSLPTTDSELVSAHLKYLSSVPLPVVAFQLSNAVSTIRMSLSQNVLKHLLPMGMTLRQLACLRDFFLLGRGEFAIQLISEADNRVRSRQQSMGQLLQKDPVKALQSLSLKDTELQQTLSMTWKALRSRDEDADDEVLDFGYKYMSISSRTDSGSRPSTSDSAAARAPDMANVSFYDLLFPGTARLGMTILQPLDLIMSQTDMDTYSAINAFLLGLRRAQVRLSELWRRTLARRDGPTVRGSTTGAASSPNDRERHQHRRTATRKVWATCSAAIFLLSETSGYFEGEVIHESWSHFEEWVKQPAHQGSEIGDEDAQHDPETLASGHRAFLASLTYALLLNDLPYTRDLRSLLGNVDHLIAFFNRQLEVQQKLDLERDAGGENDLTLEEEQRVSLELDRARKKVDSDLKSVVNRLRQLDQERIGSGRYLDAPLESAFEPWRGGGVDRLLMKLEFGGMGDQEYE